MKVTSCTVKLISLMIASILTTSWLAAGLQPPPRVIIESQVLRAGPPKVVNADQTPNVMELVRRLRTALVPFEKGYRQLQRTNARLDGCKPEGCPRAGSLFEAQQKCADEEDCGGFVALGKNGTQPYEMRLHKVDDAALAGNVANLPSWVKVPQGDVHYQAVNAHDVFHAFTKTVDAALSDTSLHLDSNLRTAPREDDTIFVSIASYRDSSCPLSLKKAYERADHPEKVHFGIVQLNCENRDHCMWADGWGDTRRLFEREGADVDCAKSFCEGEGRVHCEAGRVRVLRLDEGDAYGPFFTRFLNSQLWRGETLYMQIDAHTDFREGWDTSTVRQMRATPTYPNTVLSNYPEDGTPADADPWPRASKEDPPISDALCGLSFEDAGEGRTTVRLERTGRDDVENPNRRPLPAAFVAAGFFVAHSSFLQKAPFDPYLPFIFMGEEITLSIRFWTNGFDIYTPSEETVRHEYVRKESPKYWETIGMVFSLDGFQNELSNTVIPRVQRLVGFPEARLDSQVDSDDLSNLNQFGLGTKRSAADFAATMGIDLVAKKQETPQWCLKGQAPAAAGALALIEEAKQDHPVDKDEQEEAPSLVDDLPQVDQMDEQTQEKEEGEPAEEEQ